MLTSLLACSAVTSLVTGGFCWLGRAQGWASSLASACVKGAVFWMLLFFATFPLVSSSREIFLQLFGCSMLFALFHAVAALAVALLAPRPAPENLEAGSGLTPESPNLGNNSAK
jgi:hypothetical protein